jgi:hypothetical protein
MHSALLIPGMCWRPNLPIQHSLFPVVEAGSRGRYCRRSYTIISRSSIGLDATTLPAIPMLRYYYVSGIEIRLHPLKELRAPSSLLEHHFLLQCFLRIGHDLPIFIHVRSGLLMKAVKDWDPVAASCFDQLMDVRDGVG